MSPTVNLGTRSDGAPFRPCMRDECVAPAHIENCFRCAGFGEMVRAEDGATVLVTAAQASRGDLPQMAVKFLRCTGCGSDFRGIRGLEESRSGQP
jgi:hypothetical protein